MLLISARVGGDGRGPLNLRPDCLTQHVLGQVRLHNVTPHLLKKKRRRRQQLQVRHACWSRTELTLWVYTTQTCLTRTVTIGGEQKRSEDTRAPEEWTEHPERDLEDQEFL